MGEIYDQFVRDLSKWQIKYQGKPKAELMHLLFLGLEREAIVSVAYRDHIFVQRLQTMPISPEIQELIRHSLIWAWKDEEMHAIYIRGVIFKRGNLLLRLRAFVHQSLGITGGWAGSVRQHLSLRTAPISYMLATWFTWVGILTGQVPPDVRKYLQHGSFREFCLFNIDAEKTAWLSYQRLLDVLANLPDLPAHLIDDFRRIQEDEERHTRIFEIMAAAIDEHDQLVAGVTAEGLRDKIGAIGQVFLPRSQRNDVTNNPIGSGGPVWIVQGNTAEEKSPRFRALLDDSGISDQLNQRAQDIGKPIQELKIAIKPSFMLGYAHKDMSPVTDPELIKELAQYFYERGCRDIAVVEARNIYDQFFQHRTVEEVARYFNITSPYFRIVDATEEQVSHNYYRGLAQYSVGKTWQEADYRISFGKLSSHPVDMVYLSIANLQGMGARCDEFLFSERQTHRDTAIMMLLNDFPVHFAILDAYDTAPDGLLGLMGSPRPKTPHRFYAGYDPLAVDIVAERHIGVSEISKSFMVRTACYWFGDPTDRIKIIGPDEPILSWRHPYQTEWTTLLSLMAYPMYQFGSGRGALFVAEMDEIAFPPVKPEGLLLRAGRKGIQALLGLRHKNR